MESPKQKSLERVISQSALQASSWFPCQTCALGFLSGVCMAYILLASHTSTTVFHFGLLSFNKAAWNSSPEVAKCKFPSEKNVLPDLKKADAGGRSVSMLHSTWSAYLLELSNEETKESKSIGFATPGIRHTFIAPHLEDCENSAQINECLDKFGENRSYPPWMILKDSIRAVKGAAKEHLGYLKFLSEEAYPPWIVGADKDNYPLTREVQHDIWIHQHPLNCRDPNVRFLVADWERLPGYGIGAQIVGMCGLLAIAIKENQVLVTGYYNRADHDGCKGSTRSSWSCYFHSETSQECSAYATELMVSKEAWKNKTLVSKDNYSSKQIWAGHAPSIWGDPWNSLQPTTEINGCLVGFHRKMDLRWWRAQAVRYLMRFQTRYTCNLMNAACNAAFGKEAAASVLASIDGNRKKQTSSNTGSGGIEDVVWSKHKPWIPRLLVSMHVRMGDKVCEMKVVEFEDYMHLAGRIRRRFPHVNRIWLSTEMQEVINKSRLYPEWRFYYTNVTRQVHNISMAEYEASLGRETSTYTAFVNFLMASKADFFVGALGSTWCFLIDGMRNTGGKVVRLPEC